VSIDAINARWGSTVSVYRPTETDDSITWGSAIFTSLKLDLMPVTNEIAREVFGADVKVECMILTTSDIRKGDGLVVTAGTHSGTRWRINASLVFRKFNQLAAVRTTETIA
jgi:hypothetical protein